MHTCTPGVTNSVNRWVHRRPVIVAGGKIMSIHCRAQSQKNRANVLIFLASMLSKVTAMPRNRAAVSGTQHGLSLGKCLSANSWLDRRSPLPSHKNSWLTCANIEKFPLCSLLLLRANYTTKCHNAIFIRDLRPGEKSKDRNGSRGKLRPMQFNANTLMLTARTEEAEENKY